MKKLASRSSSSSFALPTGMWLGALLAASLVVAPASAQYVPTACDMSAGNVTYGSITVGSAVQLAMHTPWRGDANWNADMNGFVGMTALVTSLDGVDDVGCPVVRVNVDSGRFYWRIRDMRVLSVGMPAPPPAADPIPRYCGLAAATAQFGVLRPGVEVVLGAHTFAGPGDDLDWSPEMSRYVGARAMISSVEGVDTFGCPVVRVNLDGGQYYWRIRDMQLVQMAPPPPPPQMAIPTWCGQPQGAPQYGPIRPGSWVVLGMHTADAGDPNWTREMSRWVGQQTTVTSVSGTDSQGCPTVRVAADGGQYAWRIRNMTFLR